MYIGVLTLFLLLTAGIVFIARYPTDRDTLKVLYHAGPNVSQLLKTFDHYKRDSDERKFEAAKFLIRNLYLHPHFEDTFSDEKLEWVLEHADSTRRGLKKLDDSLVIAWADIRDKTRPRKMYDARVLSSDFLIEHIDRSFAIWDSSAWHDHFSFDQFCEYFLPYKGDESKPEPWLEYYQDRYSRFLEDSFEVADLPELVQKIYDEALQKASWHHLQIRRHLTPIEKDRLLSGACRYRSDWYGHIFRSLGMPVANIYCPDEANTVGSIHFWNARIGRDRKWHEIVERNEVVRDLEIIPPKVFLRPWGKQDHSFRSIASRNGVPLEDIPPRLSPWNIIDITAQIVPASDVTIKINKRIPANTRFVYLGTYEERNCIPVYWAEINGKEATFDQMATNALYLPVFYKDDQCNQAGDIFVLYDGGEVIHFDPDTSVSIEITMDRVYPIRHYLMSRHLQHMQYSTFEGSNELDFSQVDTLFQMPRYGDYLMKPNQDNAMVGRWMLDDFWQDIELDDHVVYRFIRFKARKYFEFRIGDLEVYDQMDNRIVPDAIFGNLDRPERISDGVFGWDFMDGNPGAWVVLDLGKPMEISKLRFLPYDIHPASIQEGDEYQLSIWDGTNWKSIFRMTANEKGIPCKLFSGGLFLFENMSRNVYARPFSYNFNSNLLEWW